MAQKLRWGRPLLRSDIEDIAARKKAKKLRHDTNPAVVRSTAIKEKRRREIRRLKNREIKLQKREASMPQRLLEGLDEAERLRQELGWS